MTSDNIVFERGLSENPDTFMWVSPVPEKIPARHNLVQRECPDNTKIYKDVLIYRKNYERSDLDKKFIAEVHKSIKNNFC